MASNQGSPARKVTNDLKTNRKSYQPAIGRDFGIEEIKAKDSYETSRTRDKIALSFLSCAIFAMATAAIYGLRVGRFEPVEHVWSIAGPFAGAIGAYYFNRDRKDSG